MRYFFHHRWDIFVLYGTHLGSDRGLPRLIGAGTVVVGGIEASQAARHEVPAVTSTVTQAQSTSDQILANQDKSETVYNAEQLATETAAIEESSRASSSISTVPAELPITAVGQPITNVGLAASLNDAFRGMIQKTGKRCNAITDHVWVTPQHVSIMCDRRLRAAFIYDADGSRLGGPGERLIPEALFPLPQPHT